jgi:xanthine dehydrogenase YagS FAD-binding subunit
MVLGVAARDLHHLAALIELVPRIGARRLEQPVLRLRARDRASYEFAVVSAAVALTVEDGVIREARLAVGGVGTRPWRLRDCEAALAGQKLERPAFEAAAALATRGARPLHHNHYKVELLPRTIVRTLEMAGEVA